MTSATNKLPDLYELWDYNDPAATRAKFKKVAASGITKQQSDYDLELQTQIARTYGLEADFEKAHEILDSVERHLNDTNSVTRIRYYLERGRTFRSSGQLEKSQTLFTDAFAMSEEMGEDFHAIDAAHMMALAFADTEKKMDWNLRAAAIAAESTDPRARKWQGSLYNNIGWDYFSREDYTAALEMFERALILQREHGAEDDIRVAQWCVAKAFRFLGRTEDALDIQLSLLDENKETGASDGYVFEELAELYLTLGKTAKSCEFFALAYAELSKDIWLVRNESARLERIKKLGVVAE